MNWLDLPVYRHKDLILAALEKNQAVVVESPTGSGKTTQLPVILEGAGYADRGVIGVTQPRRIAAVSVSEFIARQSGSALGGDLVGYKMRFEDRTGPATKIKIMTDGILLQEMKLDPWLSKYGVLVVDEAHERSLNIDFILGLLKRVLEARKDFKVIVSSATINAEVFSAYFGECPIVKIDAQTWPVTLIYDPPAVSGEEARDGPRGGNLAEEALLAKIDGIVERVTDERREGDILIFLPGEKMIKDLMVRLASGPSGRYLHILPLYGRLGREEQERVFDPAPRGLVKTVISTNIAETSVTIDGITTVIDSGLSKLNYYNPKTFTSSLVEGPVSKASANQRKGRAGRTAEGTCYRLYTRKDFENRPLFTTEEIYRTDLSEVVLRMADLGITAFEEFDFISPPGTEGIIAAIETLHLLEALEKDRSLSRTGKMMTEFPLPPRQSRIIVEAILHYPDVTEETLIAAAFLSTQSPWVLPPGEETDARQAHHRFRDPRGDFVSWLRLFRAYAASPNRQKFCGTNYLDEKAMAEIFNVTSQLEETVSAMGVPVLEGGSTDDYLSCIATGLVQFLCVREGRELYRSLTADRILIHPGSVMFRENPPYIVAGEIIRTTRMYAMSVSPLSRTVLERLRPEIFSAFGSGAAEPGGRPKKARDFTNSIRIGSEVFEIVTEKGKKTVMLPWEKLSGLRNGIAGDLSLYRDLRGTVLVNGAYRFLAAEKLSLILKLLPSLDPAAVEAAAGHGRGKTGRDSFSSREDLPALAGALSRILAPALWKKNRKELGFLFLFTDGMGNYWFKCSRGFHTGLNESLAALEALIDELGGGADAALKGEVNQCYRRLSGLLG